MSRSAPAWAQHDRSIDDRLIERLVPLAVDLAVKAGPFGLTIRQLRGAAVKAGFLTGHEMPSKLSFLPVVMQRAGLFSSGRRVKRWRFYPPSPVTTTHVS